jgi:hypothetical protein
MDRTIPTALIQECQKLMLKTNLLTSGGGAFRGQEVAAVHNRVAHCAAAKNNHLNGPNGGVG